jgi:hypothetical protein
LSPIQWLDGFDGWREVGELRHRATRLDRGFFLGLGGQLGFEGGRFALGLASIRPPDAHQGKGHQVAGHQAPVGFFVDSRCGRHGGSRRRRFGSAALRRQAAKHLADGIGGLLHLTQLGQHFLQAAILVDTAHAGAPLDAEYGAFVVGHLPGTTHVEAVAALEFPGWRCAERQSGCQQEHQGPAPDADSAVRRQGDQQVRHTGPEGRKSAAILVPALARPFARSGLGKPSNYSFQGYP